MNNQFSLDAKRRRNAKAAMPLHERLHAAARSVLGASIGILLCIVIYAATTDTVFAQQNSVIRPVPNTRPTAVANEQAQARNNANANAGGANRTPNAGDDGQKLLLNSVNDALSPGGMTSTLKIMLLMTVISLAPSILIMTTCFIRFVIVLGLLRQALGTQQLPPNQVIISLCLFLTLMIMSPVWQESYEQGIAPYTQGRPIPGLLPGEDPVERVFHNTVRPLRQFMSDQIDKTGNEAGVWTLLEFHRPDPTSAAGQNYRDPKNFDEVPLSVLLPAYMLSELKTAFVIGFQLYLPFVVIDMVISSILISMGMMMLPPVLISLPFKLLLFVMIDGWFLVVGMLLESVRAPYG